MMKDKILKLPKIGTIIACIMIVLVYFALTRPCIAVCRTLLQEQVSGVYFNYAISEGVKSLVSLLILLTLGYKAVLKEKGQGFFHGLYVGGVWLVFSISSIMLQLYLGILSHNSEFCSVGEITAFAITMFLVGITEEVLLRGVILNLLLERFSVWPAVIIESLIFGAIHFTNVLAGASFIAVFWQVVSATLGGVLLSAIYVRGKNIWVVIAIHGIYDFAGLFQSGVLGMGTPVENIGSTEPSWLLYLLMLLLAIYLLRKRKNAGSGDAVLSVLFGLFSIVMGFTGIFWSIGVMGVLAAKWSQKAQPEKNKLAKVGMILSIIGTVASFAAAVGLVLYFGAMSEIEKYYFLKKLF